VIGRKQAEHTKNPRTGKTVGFSRNSLGGEPSPCFFLTLGRQGLFNRSRIHHKGIKSTVKR
jgi:hypothetical protein